MELCGNLLSLTGRTLTRRGTSSRLVGDSIALFTDAKERGQGSLVVVKQPER